MDIGDMAEKHFKRQREIFDQLISAEFARLGATPLEIELADKAAAAAMQQITIHLVRMKQKHPEARLSRFLSAVIAIISGKNDSAQQAASDAVSEFRQSN